MSVSAREFQADLRKFAAVIDISADDALRKILFEAFTKIVLRSPVDTGRFRASWTMHEASPDTTVAAEFSGPKRNRRGPSYAAPKTPELQLSSPWTVVFINNSLPYAEPLELGHSKQAPNGMVTLTAEELTHYIQRISKETA